MVTIGTGPKVFCSGFNTKFWAKKEGNMTLSLMGFQKLVSRIIQLGFPTLAILNGHAIGAGVFLALAHDRAIMDSNPDFTVCTNELSFGMAFPYSYVQMLRAFCAARVARQMLLGPRLSPMKAVEWDII